MLSTQSAETARIAERIFMLLGGPLAFNPSVRAEIAAIIDEERAPRTETGKQSVLADTEPRRGILRVA